MTNPEHSPHPPQDPLTEARTYHSFDSWLTQISDERLHYLIETAKRIEAEEVKDETALAHILGIAIHFSGKEALSTTEVTRAFTSLSVRVALEIHVREGNMTKEGIYSLKPEKETAVLTLTDRGRAAYEQERNP